MGRPSDYTKEIADAICESLADGLSLRSICEADTMPNKATVFRWLDAHTEFSDQYARAREAQADTLADEMLDIADDGHNDWMKRQYGEDERWVENGEAIARSRLRVDTRKWAASKLKPKKYGDKVDLTHAGADGGAIKHLHEVALVAVDATPSRTATENT